MNWKNIKSVEEILTEPAGTADFRSRFVATSTRTSTAGGWLLPTRSNSRFIFTGTLAFPVFAQVGASPGGTTETSNSSTTNSASESLHQENSAPQSGPVADSVERKYSQHNSEDNEAVTAAGTRSEEDHQNVEQKDTSSSTKAAADSGTEVEHSSTSRRTDSESSTNSQ